MINVSRLQLSIGSWGEQELVGLAPEEEGAGGGGGGAKKKAEKGRAGDGGL